MADLRELRTAFDDLLVADVKRHGGIPNYSAEQMRLHEAIAAALAAPAGELKELIDPHKYESEALAIVKAIRNRFLPAMDENDGGEILLAIMDLIRTARMSASAPVADTAQCGCQWSGNIRISTCRWHRIEVFAVSAPEGEVAPCNCAASLVLHERTCASLTGASASAGEAVTKRATAKSYNLAENLNLTEHQRQEIESALEEFAAPAGEATPQWQPMETAPTAEGDEAIVISGEGNVYRARRDGEGWFARNVGRWMPVDDLAGWMPLPAPVPAPPHAGDPFDRYLECPCCGDVGAIADVRGEFYDGQLLVCGCPGMVSCDSETEPWINNGDTSCPKCQPAPPLTGVSAPPPKEGPKR